MLTVLSVGFLVRNTGTFRSLDFRQKPTFFMMFRKAKRDKG